MKPSLAVIAISAALASCAALAATDNDQPASSNYAYGMDLDVAKVISITPPRNVGDCQIGTAHMVYLDHHDQKHEISYREMSNCPQQ